MRQLLRMYALPAHKYMLQQHSTRVTTTKLARLLVRVNKYHAKSHARNANAADRTAQVMLLSFFGSISNHFCMTRQGELFSLDQVCIGNQPTSWCAAPEDQLL